MPLPSCRSTYCLACLFGCDADAQGEQRCISTLSDQKEISPRDTQGLWCSLWRRATQPPRSSLSQHFFLSASISGLCSLCDMDWKDALLLAEQDYKTPQPPSGNDAIYHMNMGNKNTIKGVFQIHSVLLVFMLKPAEP